MSLTHHPHLASVDDLGTLLAASPATGAPLSTLVVELNTL